MQAQINIERRFGYAIDTRGSTFWDIVGDMAIIKAEKRNMETSPHRHVKLESNKKEDLKMGNSDGEEIVFLGAKAV